MSLTIRGLDAGVKARLRRRAAERGHSMEEEARQLLAQALAQPAEPKTGLADAIHALFAPLGGVELELPPREMGREPPTFE
ncbi:FitA-like ribbon-helix-helix domain-containing protein [Blastochloris viridis]|uniref:VapB protein n=1 Tax=Blastochloris viridis TaxID=1079 RepID=A0A182D0W9_BLAVI|nr:plasmid stabilization protein [Blastochloris viridis]BAR99075.1 VapB protein [Blastochloris viridis]